ncbi:MAG: hypothetical protein Q9157_006667 [Trypethelium eluteriae]
MPTTLEGEDIPRPETIIQEKPKRKWQSYIWDTFDKSPEERKFLFKLDTCLLTFASLGYFIKYLDQANINNAFVSGMKEDLGLYQNQLNYMTTAWTVGYVIGEDIAFAQKRMELEGRRSRAETFNNGAAGAVPVFAQYLKDSKHPKYTIRQINDYPTTTYAVQVVTTLAYAWISDSVLDGARYPPIVFGGIINIICYVSLAIWNIPNGWRWTCFIISGAGYGLSGLCMA